MTPAFSPTRHVTDFSAPCGIPAHACLCVALFICHPPFPILPSQRRPPCRDAKSCVSRPLHHPSTHTKSPSIHRGFPLVRRKILRLYFRSPAILYCENHPFIPTASACRDAKFCVSRPIHPPPCTRQSHPSIAVSPLRDARFCVSTSAPLRYYIAKTILPSQWRPPVETQNLASPVLSTPLHAHDIPVHPSLFPPRETQDFASLLSHGHPFAFFHI